jgi:hypothetical protein
MLINEEAYTRAEQLVKVKITTNLISGMKEEAVA